MRCAGERHDDPITMPAAGNVDRAAAHIDDTGAANAELRGLVERASRRAFATMPAIALPAIPPPDMARPVLTDIDSGARLPAPAEIQVKTLRLRGSGHAGEGSNANSGGKSGSPEHV
jgi:hypothetical protein